MQKTIENIKGYELLDSRGNPTVGVTVTLSDGAIGTALSPSGASTGAHEAHELRDGAAERYGGKGCLKAVENVNNILLPGLKGMPVENQVAVDERIIDLDGTGNKSGVGANAALAVSLAVAKAAAASYKMPLYRYLGGANAQILPRPMMNVLNGGAHAKNNIDIQEFMIVPVNSESFAESLRCCSEIYHTLGKLLSKYNMTGVGDEGGFAPDLKDDEQAIEMLCYAIENTGYSTNDVKIALDIAASEWYRESGIYHLPKRDIDLTGEQLIKMYGDFCRKFPVISIEDGLAEDDWASWQEITRKMGNKVQLVGDDLFVTNKVRLNIGIYKGVANAVLVKPNQIGTLSETLEVVRMAQRNGYGAVISHRSGETEDTSIADIAVATNAGQIKTGAPCRTDRTAKYNRLLVIEKELTNS